MEFEAPTYDHVWLVIGRKIGSKDGELKTWGDAAVWCDPWQLREGRAYKISDFLDGDVLNLDKTYKLDSVASVESGRPKTLAFLP